MSSSRKKGRGRVSNLHIAQATTTLLISNYVHVGSWLDYQNYMSRKDSVNPYDQGCVKNWKELFCKRAGPSLINFRATYYRSKEVNRELANVTQNSRGEEQTPDTIDGDRQPSSERSENHTSPASEGDMNGQVSQVCTKAIDGMTKMPPP